MSMSELDAESLFRSVDVSQEPKPIDGELDAESLFHSVDVGSDKKSAGKTEALFKSIDTSESPTSSDLRQRLKIKDSLLNKIGYVKNRVKEDVPDKDGWTLDDYRNLVQSSQFNTLDDETVGKLSKDIDTRHAETANKRGFGRIIMDAGARGFQRAVDMDRASNFVGKKVDQEGRDARQALVDVENENDIAHPRSVGSVKNIRGVGDAVTMAAESMAENIPNMLMPVASSIAGAKAGGAIGASGGPAGALAGATIGSMTGGFLGGLRMNVGEAVMDQTREGLELNRGLALGQGIGYSLLDMGGAEVAAARRIAVGTLAVPLREAKKEFVASIGKLAKTIGKDMFREGWTEAAQSGFVGNTRRKIQTGSFTEPGNTPGDLVWNALDEAYGGAFAGGGMSMVTTGYQYAGNKKMVKHADAEISRMAQDTDIAKLDPYDRVILAKTRVNMAVRADVESSLSDIEGTRKQMVDDFLASKQAQKMTETERNSHIDKNLSSDAIRENLTKTIESIDKYDVEARDTLGGTAKTVLNAYESEFSNMSIDDVPVDYKSDFDSSEIAGMRDSKIVEPDGSETYKGPKTDIMIEGRPGAYSIRNNNGMKMPIGESGVVDTLEEAVAFASKLARFNQYRIDNNASKAAFIKGVAEKSHPGANVVQVDSPKQIKDPDARARMVGGEQAFYNPKDNTVYAMLDSIQNPAQAEIMLQHEDTHRALLEMMTKEGLIQPGESIDSAKRRFFGTNTSRGAERSEESVARANERGGADRNGLEKFRDLAQMWISKKTGIKSIMGNAELRLLLDKLNAISKQGTGGTVSYNPEGASDANKLRYQDSFYGQGTLEEQAQRQNESATDAPVSQERVINRDTKRSGLVAGMNQPVEPSTVVEKPSVPQETDRPTRHRVFEGGSPITVSNPNALRATDTTKAYRLTDQSQVDDMLDTGGVRAREGKMKGGHTGEVHWSAGHDTLGYNPSDGKYVIETDYSNLNEREGMLPNSAVRLWKVESGKWVDVTNMLAPKRESTTASTVRTFVRTELRTDRIKEKHGDLFNQAMDVTDGDEQAATGLVSEWLAGQNIADKSIPDSVRVASKLEQKADLTAKDADTLEQNAIFGKDLFLFGYRKDKETGAWKFQQPVQEPPQSTPVEPVTSEPVVAEKPAEPKPSAGDKMRRESFMSFFDAANQSGEYDLLQRWYEGNGLFGKPSKTAGGEYDAYRAMPPRLRKMIRGKSKSEITAAAKEISEELGPEYADPVIGPELIVNEFVRQYAAYQKWKENGAVPDVQADEYSQRAKYEAEQEKNDLAVLKQKVDNGEVIADGTPVYASVDEQTAKEVGIDPDFHAMRVQSSYVKNGALVYRLMSANGKIVDLYANKVDKQDISNEVEYDESERDYLGREDASPGLESGQVQTDSGKDYDADERAAIEWASSLDEERIKAEGSRKEGLKNNGSLFDEKALPFNLDGGTQEDVVRIAAEKKAEEAQQAEAKRKLDEAPVLPGIESPVVVTEKPVGETQKPLSSTSEQQPFKRGTKVATTRNADGVSYFGEVLQSNPDGTVKIRAFKEKAKGTIAAKTYGVDKAGNRVTKDVDVPAESVKSVDATADTSKLTDAERRKLKMAEAVDAANADNELRKGSVEAPKDIVDSFNSAKERKEQRKTDNGLRFRRSTATPEQDAAYMKAVERGDMETAQSMVDEAAKKAGYKTGYAYHSEDGNLNEKDYSTFDTKGNYGAGVYFSFDKNFSESYGHNTTRAHLRLRKPIRGYGSKISPKMAKAVLDELKNTFPDNHARFMRFFDADATRGDLLEWYQSLVNFFGNDAAREIFPRITGHDGVYAENGRNIVIFNPEQIKSADPVTRDDQGNVIHLSQRFNEATPDIRFRRSMSGTPSGADILDTETGLQAARRIVQDYMQPWERKQEALQKTLKRKLPGDVDVYRAEDRSYGLIRNGVHQFEKNFIDKAEKVLNENGLTVDEFDQFLMAKAGPDRNKMIADRTEGKNLTGSGQSDVYWNNILAAYRKQGKYDKLNEAAEHVWALNRAVLDMKVEAGLMSKAQADVWKTKSPFYVPLRSDDAEADYKGLGKRASFSLKRKESKSATGRAEGHEADTPFAFSVMQSLEAVGRANKNVVYETAAKLIEQNPSDLWHIEKRIPTKQAYDSESGKVISVPDAQFEDAPNVVIVKRDGKKQYLVFEGADGLKLARSLKKDSLQKAPAMVSALTRTYAMMRTAMVPTFILRNLRADFLQLTINMTAENKARMVPEVFKSMKDSWQAVWSYERDGKASGALAGYANEFFSNGGQIAGVGVQTVDKINQTLNKHVKKHGTFMKNVMKAEHFYEYIERGNATIETGTRLALYATLRKQGYSISDSIEAGKNITVNFNRKGELGPFVNSLYMFSNVAVQDAARSVKALSGKNGKAVVLGLLGAGFLAAMLNNGDDDDEEDKTGAGSYKNIPESDKQRNIIIKVGGKYIKQPIRGIWAWIYYAGTKAGDVAFGKYDSAKAAKNVAGAAFDTINFLGTSGSVTQFLAPTIFDPVIQHRENRDWKGSPIYQRKFTDAQPDSATGMKRTPEWIKATAKGLNRLTGGDDATKGLIDVAPETIKFGIDTLAGGIGTDASYAVGAVSDAAKGNFDVDKTPFVRDVVRDLPDSTREYYVAKDKFEAGVYAVNHYKTAKERSAYYRKNPFMEPRVAERIKNLNKTIKEIRESESKTDKDDRKKLLEARRLRLQATMLRLMETGVKK